MIDPDAVSWDEVRKHLYCVLVTEGTRTHLPADALLMSVGGQLDVAFQVANLDGEVFVTPKHLAGWNIAIEEFADAAGWNGGQVTVWDWPQVKKNVRLFQYPDRDTLWINHIVSPGCLLEHTDVPNSPVIMVPTETTVFIAGSPDEKAQALMLEKCVNLCRKRPPLTKRPLIIDKAWKNWEVFPDEQNPLAKEYREAFGKL